MLRGPLRVLPSINLILATCTSDLSIDMNTSADDIDDCFDTDSEDNDTVIVDTPSEDGPVGEASEMLEDLSLGVEASSK